jgi:hypothetical protein
VTDDLRREGIRFVYANHWLSAWVQVDSGGQIGALESNINLNDSSRTKPSPEVLFSARLEKGIGILLGSDADTEGIRGMLEAQRVGWREVAVGPYRLLVIEPGPRLRPLDKREWSATATEEAKRAPRAIDGRRHTRWSSAGPAGSTTSLTIDFGTPHRIRQVQVRPGGPPAQDPRLWGSVDGAAWRPLGPVHWAGPLFWTGSELLRNGTSEWVVAFPPVEIRYLRLGAPLPAGPAPWSLFEVDCFE